MSYTIRPLTAEELPLAEPLYCNAFKITRETAQRWTSLTSPEITRAVVEGSRVLSILSIIPFEVWMFGRRLPMGGIAGVATWGDQQGKGFAGQLLRRAIEDMHQMDYSISMLYPFSFRFYERFGYTLCGDSVTYTAAPADFMVPPADEELQIRAASLPDDLPAIRQAYDSAAPIWNCMINRGDSRWNWWMQFWQGERRHVYLLESADDKTPEGYFTVEDIPLPDGGFEAHVPELVLASELHLGVVTRFFSRSPASVKSIRLTMPRTPALWQLFREPTVETRVRPTFQARVIDVPKACMERGYESDVTADITFAVHDPCAAWNAGPWRLKLSDGRAEVKPAPMAEHPLMLTIQEFTSIFVGYQKATDLVLDQTGHVAELEALDDIFYDADTRLLDHF